MKAKYLFMISAVIAGLTMVWPVRVNAGGVYVQCPGDVDGDAVPDFPDPAHPNATCLHLAAGDGFGNMADGYLQYLFGFSDATGVDPEMVMEYGMIGANLPSPTIALAEGEGAELYLTLTNVGMMMRPDLFDPHTVHWHGYSNAASVFDGVPEASLSINMGASLTYYYTIPEPGTYIYHCHVEATEHMQMGMLGNLYVTPAQNNLPDGTDLNGFTHHTGYKYVYNDGDGSTYYDVEMPLLLEAFDPVFHDASLNVQPLPFALMDDKYAMFNGRGYPDTVNEAELPNSFNGDFSQKMHSMIRAQAGDVILLRIASLSTVRHFTVTVLGIPMTVVGRDARQLRAANGDNLYYQTNSITLGGGETMDVLLYTDDVVEGTYFIYTTNLNYLSNDSEDFGGMMTEIEISG
ncbi:multicopper oxidase domain-containing protein [bacterium]|nr:multicopper oxidase domain-containing protein [candidate division CSSED10-310 bacterium]